MGRIWSNWISGGVLALFLVLVSGQGTVAATPEEDGLWRSIAEGLSQSIAIKRQELTRIRQHLPERKAQLAGDLSRISSRLDQLLLLRGVAGETPWASRTLLLQFAELSHAVSAARSPLEDVQDTLARTKQEYTTLRQIRAQNASREYAELVNEELAGPGHDFKELKHDVDTVKTEVDDALGQATALSSDIQAAHTDEVARFIEVFGQTYFASSGSLLRPANLSAMLDDLQEWADAGPRFWGPILAVMPWGAFLGLTLLDSAVALGLLRLLLRRRPETWQALRLGFIWLALGLGLFAARCTLLFIASQFVALTWAAVMAYGLFLLARGGRVLPVLFACFLAGVALDMFNLPGSVVCALWTVIAGLGAWRLGRCGSCRCLTLWLLAGAAVASLCGFGPQALFVVQAFFMLHLAVYISGTVQRGLSALAGGRERSLAQLAQPLAATVLAALFIAWVLVFMGGPGLVEHVFGLDVVLGKAVISLEAVSWLIISFFLLRLVQAWFQEVLILVNFRGKPMDPGLAHTVGAAFSYVTWTGYMLFALRLFEVPLGALTWIASGLSVGIGFGLKDIVNNFISGLIIMFGGTVKKGDIIQQGKNLGEVVDLSVRNTIVRTLDNTTVIIPNSSFLRGEIVNLSYHGTTMRLTIPVTVAPGTKIKKIKKLLLAIAKEHKDVLKQPGPEVLLRSFGRYGLEFDLQVWIDNFIKKFNVQSELAIIIDQSFQENKILVPFQGVKVKYKPMGTEEMQLEASREALRQKRGQVFGRVRLLRRVHARRRWPTPTAVAGGEE
ncbi:mechanosensitive ion channel domain-containing protein [Desulfovibrio sp. TomC]|uniref:mechanosensitive ion channel domain-containing protein n=1 Tax=Desulfovibrio sp. TomC TaxID=1562888 RepID=UPI00057332A6|nr:mechanosensitive ion channel domain-containing protein [Desulfovibrio sp. TomC]KHK01199.1 Potassium efflux system KefA protein / Small-conductance mechanosensitive channel [Desulfovibrio sp. TomC]